MAADFRSKRKQDNIQENERREVAVKIMVNQSELALIEAARAGTKLSLAETIRAMVIGKKIDRATIVPQVNIDLARDLGRSLGNLATLAVAMRAGKFAEIEDVQSRIIEFQQSLRGQK